MAASRKHSSPTCPKKFPNRRAAAAWMIRTGRALLRSNRVIAPYISRRDNNINFEAARHMIETGRRIARKYGSKVVAKRKNKTAP